MEKIKNYIDRFFRKHKKNLKYSMNVNELFIFMDIIMCPLDINEVLRITSTLFDYGYVKGYRAALSEVKKEALNE